MSCEFTARAQSSNSFNDLIPTLDGSSWRQMLSVAALNMEISPTNLSFTHHRVDFSSTVEEVCASYASLNENSGRLWSLGSSSRLASHLFISMNQM